MGRRAPALIASALALASVASCAREYRPPHADEPHATIQVRRTYLTGGGTHLYENADVTADEAWASGELFRHRVGSSEATTAATTALRRSAAESRERLSPPAGGVFFLACMA